MTTDYIRTLNFFIKTLNKLKTWRFFAIFVGVILYVTIPNLAEILGALKDLRTSTASLIN